MREERAKERPQKEKSRLRETIELIIYLLVVVAVAFLIIRYVGQRTVVIGSSMEGTLSDGDNLIVDKLSYRFHKPERFDIVVFPHEEGDQEVYYIKRVIGLPGETVQIVDGEIYINGSLLEESYGREIIRDGGLAETEIVLGSDEYFVMGDNRNNSKDSRIAEVGNISADEIIGRALVRVWPITEFKVLLN